MEIMWKMKVHRLHQPKWCYKKNKNSPSISTSPSQNEGHQVQCLVRHDRKQMDKYTFHDLANISLQ